MLGSDAIPALRRAVGFAVPSLCGLLQIALGHRRQRLELRPQPLLDLLVPVMKK